MKATICASRRKAILALSLATAWIAVAMTVLDCSINALPFWLEGTLNLTLLPAAAAFAWGIARFLRPRPVLRAGKRGLWVRFPPETVGVVPWHCVSHFEFSPDGHGIRLYLKGLWDVPDGCGERFSIETDKQGRRMLFLPIRHRTATSPGKAVALLEQWYGEFAGEAPAYRPEYGEVQQRRIAARSGAALRTLLPVLRFVRGKLWVAILPAYILLMRGHPNTTLAMQLLPLAPLATVWLLLRWLLGRGITALERHSEHCDTRASGL